MKIFLFYLISSILIAFSFAATGIAIDKSELYDISKPISVFKQIIPLYYEQFLPVSYCKDKEREEGKCCDNLFETQGWKRADVVKPSAEELEELKKKFKDETYNFQVLYNDKYEKILVLFPGTRGGVAQFIKEILGFTLKDWGDEGIKVMKYFLELFEAISPRVFRSVENLYSQIPTATKYQIIFEGHSLGAATATLHAFEYARSYLSKYNNVKSPALLSYGSPNVGNTEFKAKIDKIIPVIYRVVRYGDMVATIPPKIGAIDFYPTKGLAMINKEITTLYNCGDEKTGDCKNLINPLDIPGRHLHYFYSDHQVNEKCETAFHIKIKEEKEEEEKEKEEEEEEEEEEKEEEEKEEEEEEEEEEKIESTLFLGY